VAGEQSEIAKERNRAASVAKLEKFFCDAVGVKALQQAAPNLAGALRALTESVWRGTASELSARSNCDRSARLPHRAAAIGAPQEPRAGPVLAEDLRAFSPQAGQWRTPD
jgi:hypothetical protein